eukprot:scaffold391448_cov38-Prasinocladus_malaysianus.AAC.1
MGCSASTLRNTVSEPQSLSSDGLALQIQNALSSEDKEKIVKLIRNAMSFVPRRTLKQFALRLQTGNETTSTGPSTIARNRFMSARSRVSLLTNESNSANPSPQSKVKLWSLVETGADEVLGSVLLVCASGFVEDDEQPDKFSLKAS